MMNLTIDIGNTNILFCSFEGLKRKKKIIIATKNIIFDLKLKNYLINLFPKKNIKGIIISSVVPKINKSMNFFLTKIYKVSPIFVKDIIGYFDFKTLIKKKKEIGTDRIVNVLYANKIFNSSILVIDFGTATTIDYINANEIYEGGIIAPGIELSLKNLSLFTEQLPLVKFKRTKSVIGNSTKSAINSGFFWGYVSLVNGLIERIIFEKKIKPKIILTGGNAKLFDKYIKNAILIDPYFTMKGLNFMLEKIYEKK